MQNGIDVASMHSIIASATDSGFAVKAENEAGIHEHARLIDLVDAVGQRAAGVLFFLHRHQRVGVRAFDADENRKEIRLTHQTQQHRVIGDVDRRLGRELERVAALLLPRREAGQKRLHHLFVADEIVVDKIQLAAMPAFVQRLQFGQHLVGGLDPRHAPVKLDDVAEFAVEGTAARELHAEIGVLVALHQIEARDRRFGHVDGKFLRLEDAVANPGIPGVDKRLDDALGLAEHPEIGALVGFRRRGYIRAANHNRLAARLRQRDDGERIRLLRQHAAGHYHVGPVEVRFLQFLGVAINQPAFPRRR